MGLVDGTIVLVTGGAGGIGRAAAELFAAEGAEAVVVTDLDAEGGSRTVAGIEERGGDAEFRGADVTDEDQVEALVRYVLDRYGRLDCAFNNAGVSGTAGAFTDLALAEWNRVLTTDLTSVFLCLKHELRAMARIGEGAIVNTSSGAGVVASPGLPHYTAAKHGVLGLTKAAAQEYVGTDIRVNAICPGITDTPMLRAAIGGSTDLERVVRRAAPGGVFGRPEQVAETAVWLCSERASFVTGATLLVDGGAVAR
jgi:NAD(P)-dependent dehydrogenase (short-subunit alcohol dehydrogenase family)